MKKQNIFQRAAALLLILALLCALLPQTAPAARAAGNSGSCGDNLTWSYDSRTGKLTIEGFGEMEDYYFGSAPWEVYQDSIKTVSLPQGLTTVGPGAFFGCKNLRSINIPDTVTLIGFHAFSWCESLEEIAIPGSVTTIEADAFSDCISLSSVTIPGSVTNFGEFVFECCSGLKSVTLGEGLTKISAHAFQTCSGLTQINFSSTITSIDNYAFYGCKALTEVTIPETVTSLGSAVFGGCTGLLNYYAEENNPVYSAKDGILFSKDGSVLVLYPAGRTGSYAIPSTVSALGDGAFDGCKGLTAVTIPESITVISKDAFDFCEGLTAINIPSSVTSIGECAFEFCTGLTELTIPGNVSSIGDFAFYSCYALTDLTICEGVTFIGEDAFEFCTGLTELTLPGSVMVIGEWAFAGCTGLVTVTLQEGVEAIGRVAFAECTALRSIAIPDTVTFIGDDAFGSCSSLTEITLPARLRELSDYTFFGCSALTSMIIPDGVTSIGECAFAYCTELAAVTIPFSVTYIDDWAFVDCDKLTIRGYTGSTAEAFAAAHGIPFIAIDTTVVGGACGDNLTWSYDPASCALTIQGSGDMWDFEAFFDQPWNAYTTLLKSVSLPDGLTRIGNEAFANCKSLKSIVIPGSVDSIGMDAFIDCSSLESVTLQEGLRMIDEQAFYDCSSLTAVTLPESLEMLGMNAFMYCFDLRQVVIRNPDCEICAAQECGARSIEYEVETEKTLGVPGQTVIYVIHDPEKENAEMFPKTLDTIWGPLVFGFRYAENYAKTYSYTCYALGTFDDVKPGKWYEIPVAWAYGKGITTGTGEGQFSPNLPCTREQIVTFIWKAFDAPEPDRTELPFTDVIAGKYYEKAVQWAYYHRPQITSGVEDTVFGVGQPCTRAQVVTFLWNAAGKPAPETSANPFTDVKETDYFYSAVLWAVENGITSGTSPSTFSPKDTCTRAQVVTFLYKAVG